MLITLMVGYGYSSTLYEESLSELSETSILLFSWAFFVFAFSPSIFFLFAAIAFWVFLG